MQDFCKRILKYFLIVRFQPTARTFGPHLFKQSMKRLLSLLTVLFILSATVPASAGPWPFKSHKGQVKKHRRIFYHGKYRMVRYWTASKAEW